MEWPILMLLWAKGLFTRLMQLRDYCMIQINEKFVERIITVLIFHVLFKYNYKYCEKGFL